MEVFEAWIRISFYIFPGNIRRTSRKISFFPT